jgi:hypothetical protein
VLYLSKSHIEVAALVSLAGAEEEEVSATDRCCELANTRLSVLGVRNDPSKLGFDSLIDLIWSLMAF